jgi:glyoxylase-like metal-dependent hydrolase (beta-lactamase superfamily II)
MSPDVRRKIRRAMPIACVVLTAAGFGFARSVPAGQQGARPPGATYSGQAFTFAKIQDGIYHAVGTGSLSVGCNAAVIVNANDVLVVDTHISPAAAWALVDEIRTLTPKPVRYVVNTHFHFDHAHGNQIFPADVEIIGHEFTRVMLSSGRSRTGFAYEGLVGTLPKAIADLKGQIGAAPEAERGKLQERLAIQENFKSATDAVVPTPPTVTLKESLTLHRGGREIRLLFLGRGHTGGDVVVFLPKERVVVTGDLQVAGLAYMGDGYLSEWPDTLERLKALDFDTVLPGHGQAFTGKARITAFQAYLRDFWSQAEKLRKSGVSAEEAAKRIDLRAHAKDFPTIKEAGVAPVGVVRAYALMDGEAQ